MPVGVVALWRYPVKAMLGELLDAVEIGPRDRRWIVVDARTGERIANKRGADRPAAARLPRFARRAEVARGGEVRVGQRLDVEPGETTVEVAVARLVEQLASA